MPRRDDIRTILLLGSGPIVIGQGCEFDYSGTQACKALRDEGYRVVLVNSNPATIMTDPSLADRTYIEPITPEAVEKIIVREMGGSVLRTDSSNGNPHDVGSESRPTQHIDVGSESRPAQHIDVGSESRTTPIDAILPTLGGQTALNCACALHDSGILEKHGVEMIGASREVIHRAEDRAAFAEVCDALGLATPESTTVSSLPEAEKFVETIGLPAIIRPAFTLGGWGGGIAYNRAELTELVTRGLRASMIDQVQIDRSLIGWKEFELEVVRDRRDNCVIVCGIENIDAMGVHTGDSITVAPILTLTDKEYQALRDAAIAIMHGVGVETGGSNVQFAVNPNPADGKFEFVVVEMNPRVSRSSALASKATGFPIAKIAAKLAVGYTLDELRNDITGTTSACFEPSIDYVVTKMPRWTFEKFPEADETLTTQMKSVGEAMAIGRTFKESLQKVIRSMEVKRFGLGLDRNDKWLANQRKSRTHTADRQPVEWPIADDKLIRKLAVPSQGRLYYIRYALKMGWSIERIHMLTRIDPFFLDQIAQIVEFEDELCAIDSLDAVGRGLMRRAKALGFSDAQLANLYLGTINDETILAVRAHRMALGIEPVFKCVDTCAGEFEAITPYFYSTYQPGHEQIITPPGRTGVPPVSPSPATPTIETGGTPVPPVVLDIPPENELPDRLTAAPLVVILGGGPNRIGQGIEFDYCCCHAAFAARELGVRSVMINSNPETVSTDYDTSDLLFFEPLTLEDVLNVVERIGAPPGPSASEGFSDLETHQKPALALGPGKSLLGVIVQFGGQTPLNLAHGLARANIPLLGTPLDSIDRAEDRDRFDKMLTKLDLRRPASGVARSVEQAVQVATRVGYPVLVRPSYVLGGRGMEICPDEPALRHYITGALASSDLDEAPVLIDQFLDGATELDVDVVADFPSPVGQASRLSSSSSASKDAETGGTPVPPVASSGRALVCSVMEHIEQTGVHSGDSTCIIPTNTLRAPIVERVRTIALDIAAELHVCGLMNVQLAVKDDGVYIIEVNPRASRTVPFVGKATGVPWASIAAKAMMGVSIDKQSTNAPSGTQQPTHFAVKAPVFPFQKFPGVDFVLGPEMRSTGEVMGRDVALPIAFLKAMSGAGVELPDAGGVFVSVRDADKPAIVPIVRTLLAMGFTVHSTGGTAAELERHGMRPLVLEKIRAGARPNVLDLMHDGDIQLVINTPTITGWKTDEGSIRATAVRLGIPMITTATAAAAAVRAIEAKRAGVWSVGALQDDVPAASIAR